jgi:two-component system, NtrC family, sensor kinase
MRIVNTLTFRLIGGSIFILLMVFGLYSYFSVSYYRDQMMTHVVEAATRMSDVIKKSTHYSMLLNRKEDVYQTITMVGTEPGVEGIRIYNKRGEIMFSTDKAEEGTVVDMHTEACYVCHEQAKPLVSLPTDNRTRMYMSPKGYRILGLINPIRNEASCSEADCHAHPAERTMLGVLDVRMSLEKIDRDINRAQMTLVYSGIGGALFLSIIVFVYLYGTVHRPVRRLITGTREISSGNLSYQIPMISSDDIGYLAASFNAMTASLRAEKEKNRRWSEELELRVKEKTEELRRIHEQIMQIEKMASLGKLSATVAHELNNPLEGILTYAKLMAKRIRKNPELAARSTEMLEELDLIIRETERCGGIVKNLLLFSRKQVGDFGLFPVRQIVDKAAALMMHHFQMSNVKYELADEAQGESLLCDENQIQQALVALFVNAVEAMHDGGKLAVRVSRPNGQGPLAIAVTDTGTGIEAEDLQHVFEPFFTTKKDGKGVGLGLSVVFGIVERHGGKLEVDSIPGKGTTFSLIFPAANCGTNRGETSSPAPGQSTKEAS